MPFIKHKGRPRKKRIVKNEPNSLQFSPRGRIGRPGYVELKHEELEAIRLADFAGMRQFVAAADMGISQQTFSRILNKGRRTVSEALVLGKIIKVSGGDYKIEK